MPDEKGMMGCSQCDGSGEVPARCRYAYSDISQCVFQEGHLGEHETESGLKGEEFFIPIARWREDKPALRLQSPIDSPAPGCIRGMTTKLTMKQRQLLLECEPGRTLETSREDARTVEALARKKLVRVLPPAKQEWVSAKGVVEQGVADSQEITLTDEGIKVRASLAAGSGKLKPAARALTPEQEAELATATTKKILTPEQKIRLADAVIKAVAENTGWDYEQGSLCVSHIGLGAAVKAAFDRF